MKYSFPFHKQAAPPTAQMKTITKSHSGLAILCTHKLIFSAATYERLKSYLLATEAAIIMNSIETLTLMLKYCFCRAWKSNIVILFLFGAVDWHRWCVLGSLLTLGGWGEKERRAKPVLEEFSPTDQSTPITLAPPFRFLFKDKLTWTWAHQLSSLKGGTWNQSGSLSRLCNGEVN